ncbi:MAG: hypothetical protein A4E69_00280 [Syntrophus sp. PtaB.Bin138]|nr:MAG: hypothetical protein A4E69_00280 [Syntrophus sp. PtaB.Bin138]
MQGLTVLHHDEIGHIHDIVDGAQPNGFQAPPHPGRRRPDVDVTNNPCRVPGAGIGIENPDRRDSLDVLTVFGERDFRPSELPARDGRHFPRHPDDGQTVRAVRRDADVQNRVAQIQGIREILPRLQSVRQNQDARVVRTDAELFFRAKHALGAFAADERTLDGVAPGNGCTHHGQGNDIARMDVGGAADDRQGLRPGGHFTEGQLVRIRVGLDGQDFRHHHPGKIGRHVADGVHLEARHGQPVGQFRRCEIDINVIPEPPQTDKHKHTPRNSD